MFYDFSLFAASSDVRVLNVICDQHDSKFDGEGRLITVEFDRFFLVATYVPNSGQNLERLEFRLSGWDPFLRDYLCKLSGLKPVVLTGDLNVGYLDIDIHNPTAKHIVKQAGLTPEERHSFGQLLSSDFSDAFRHFYPGGSQSPLTDVLLFDIMMFHL